MIDALERVLLTAWVGALWAIGFLAVPVLFATLPEPALAGDLAGRMFAALARIGLVCGLLLLARQFARSGRGAWRAWRVWLLAAMLVITAIGAFGLAPAMQALKVAGLLSDGGENALRFGRLHAWSSALFVANAVFGLALVAAGAVPVRSVGQVDTR